MEIHGVIFDWGGTLTPWWSSEDKGWRRVAERIVGPDRMEDVAARFIVAEAEIWRRSQQEERSGTLAEIFAAAGVELTESALAIYDEEWEPHTQIDPSALPTLRGLRERGVKVGVLSNTIWSARRHERIFARDGVLELIDGAVYTSEIPWVKPHPEAFLAAMRALDITDPARCVYVGDRPFDDIFGARRAGMRAVLVPHSSIPAEQHGHTNGEPDAVIEQLTDLLSIVDAWQQAPMPTCGLSP
jgi:putative hydrolase of the HAD superfamily